MTAMADGGVLLCAVARECFIAAAAFPRAHLLMWMTAPPFRRARLGEPVGSLEALEVIFYQELVRSGRAILFAASEKLTAEVQYMTGLDAPVLLPAAIFMVPHRSATTRNEVLLSGRLFLLRSPWKHLLPQLAPEWTFVSQADAVLPRLA